MRKTLDVNVGGVLNKTPTQYITFQDGGITIKDVNGKLLLKPIKKLSK